MTSLGTLSVVENLFCGQPATNLTWWECGRQAGFGPKTVQWRIYYDAWQPGMCSLTERGCKVRVAACGGAVQADPDRTGLSMCQQKQHGKESCCSPPHLHLFIQTGRCRRYPRTCVRSASYGCTIRAPSGGFFHCRTSEVHSWQQRGCKVRVAACFPSC